MKKIKIFFYILFALDIFAGCIVAEFVNLFAGIVTASVLLILNITVYAVILKVMKVGNNKSR
ncbi:MAG: hypothetical protein LBN01_00825 [Endomicrobium sp.]|jgi:hypothetical protein|nr:hypothetical protein [Endomicrobium sp.]